MLPAFVAARRAARAAARGLLQARNRTRAPNSNFTTVNFTNPEPDGPPSGACSINGYLYRYLPHDCRLSAQQPAV